MKKIIAWTLYILQIYPMGRAKTKDVYWSMLLHLNKYEKYQPCLCAAYTNVTLYRKKYAILWWYCPEIYIQKPTFNRPDRYWWPRRETETRKQVVHKAFHRINKYYDC